MITEYTDPIELLRLISEQKIKASAVRRYLSRQGVFITANKSENFAQDVYTFLFGGADIEHMTHLVVGEGNYEKSLLVNAKLKDGIKDLDIIDYFADGFNKLRSSVHESCVVDQPVKNEEGLSVTLSYIRKLPGKNRLISEEERQVRLSLRKRSNGTVSIDIRQNSSCDAQKALELLGKIAIDSDDNEVTLSHINLQALSDKRQVSFFDRIGTTDFQIWQLSTITGVTVKKADEPDDEQEIEEGRDTNNELSGISQAILNGSGLRENSFVQNSLTQGFVISAMKYRYDRTAEASEFIVSISSKGQDLRVDIEKSYYDEDGKLTVQPFPKNEQNDIILKFQEKANEIFDELFREQLEEITSS